MKKCLTFLVIIVAFCLVGCSSNYSFYLDDLSTEEIGSLLEQYLTTLPRKGEMPEDYAEGFKYQPVSIDYDLAGSKDTLSYRFCKNEKSIPTKDALIKIELHGVYSQMDGSMGLQEDVVVRVYSVIYDYERAVKLYDQLFTILSPYYIGVEDDRDKTEWAARGLFVSRSEKAGNPCNFVSLKKQDDHYELKGILWNCLIDDEIKDEIQQALLDYYQKRGSY